MKHAGQGRFSDERGVALPVALMVMVLVSGLAVVSARAAVGTQHQTLRDVSAKRAIQAAAAGAHAITYQLNLMQPKAGQCVMRDGTGALVLANPSTPGWCPPQTENVEGAVY